MAGLPKKYAKMGFKKGWREYKKSKSKRGRKVTLRRTVKKTAKRRKTRTMARRKIVRRRKSPIGGVGKLMLGGAIYGVAREPLNTLASKVPFIGNLGDEVALLGVSYLLATRTKGMVRQMGRAGLMIEAYNLARGTGGSLLGGLINSTTATTTTSTSSTNSFR